MKKNINRKTDLVELLKKKSELPRLIYEFNRIPAGYAHSSWIEPVIPLNLFKRIQNSRRGMLKISNMILKHHHLDQSCYYDFYDAKYRLALLPSDVLRTLIFYGGIALHHKKIKTVIDKKEKRVIMDTIGEQGYRFACACAPLLIGNLENKYKWKDPLENLLDFLQECGIKLFLSVFLNDPEPLSKRVLLKFQKDMVQDNLLQVDKGDSLKSLNFYIRILKQVVEQRWQQFVL